MVKYTIAYVCDSRSSRNAPLHYAAANGESGIARLLLNKGADPSIRNEKGQTPFDSACEALTAAEAKLRSGQTAYDTRNEHKNQMKVMGARATVHLLAAADAAYTYSLQYVLDQGVEADRATYTKWVDRLRTLSEQRILELHGNISRLREFLS